MVGVVSDILEIVVLTASANALLGICGARWGVGGGLFAEEVGDELVHAGIGEEQSGGLGQQGSRGHDGVLLLFEKIEEGLSDLGARHVA